MVQGVEAGMAGWDEFRWVMGVIVVDLVALV